jgi:DNA-binding beta-propeller fold protein YncE
VCANRQLVVLDADNGHLVATLPIGDGPDGAAYDPETATVYSSNSDGTLTVIHQDDEDHYRNVTNVKTPVRSKTLTLDPKTHHVFLGAADFGAPPSPTKAEPEPKPPMLPGTFSLIEVSAP